MGVPLIVIGASGGHLLPKAGVWMNSVKAVFGVLLLGVAVWLLERVVPPSVTLGLWAALLIGSGVYMGALDTSPRAGWGQLWKATGFMGLVYGVLLLIGAASGASDPLRPLAPLLAGQRAGAAHEASESTWHAVNNLTELQAQKLFEGSKPAVSELDQQLFDDGLRHEQVLLSKLEKAGHSIARLPGKQTDADYAATRQAMAEGVEFIHQASLCNEEMRCSPGD